MKSFKEAFVIALLMSTLYLIFLGHRTDYVGHAIAGFGGTAILLVILFRLNPSPSEWKQLWIVLAAIGIGAVAEATIFKIAKFDPVDFNNQSIGAYLAGCCAVRTRWPKESFDFIITVSGLFIIAGFVLGHM